MNPDSDAINPDSDALGGHFDVLFDSRLKGDYADLTRFEAEDVSGWLEIAREFVAHIEKLPQALDA